LGIGYGKNGGSLRLCPGTDAANQELQNPAREQGRIVLDTELAQKKATEYALLSTLTFLKIIRSPENYEKRCLSEM
jgi:hypothetical protein